MGGGGHYDISQLRVSWQSIIVPSVVWAPTQPSTVASAGIWWMRICFGWPSRDSQDFGPGGWSRDDLCATRVNSSGES